MLYIGSLSTADAQELPVQDGFWVGAALGTGLLSEAVLPEAASRNVQEIETYRFSGKIDMGYDFNQYIGVYGSYDHAQHTWSRHDLHLASFGLKGKEYFTDRLSLFGKVGATYLFSGDNDNGLIGSFGLGVEYQLTNAVAMRLGADYYNDLEISKTRIGDLTQFYWGMTYRFGQPATPMVITKTVEVIKEVPVVNEVVKEVNRDVVVFTSSSEKLFSNNSSLLMSTKSLEGPLDVLKKDPKLKVNIVGHTDSLGSDKYNQWMSERRAKTVADYFIANGISPSRITALGRGESEPIANNNSELGRAQNRRVEINIYP
ncbi:OmpA family protein [Vibrio metoecus]|uniref:OmpA family protein n=1 Tax=Vibrio metoecus TaxID=1481663 RepID=UPI0013EF66BA|nr:OmpA family protein [Vibrio metoecus]